MGRSIVAVFLGAVLGLSQGVAFPKDMAQQSATELRTIKVRAHYTEPPGQVSGVDCQVSTLECEAGYAGSAYFTGTFDAEQDYDLRGWVEPSGRIVYWGPVHMNGTVKGCGTGTFILYERGWVDATRFDPVTQSAPGFNTWRVRRGSGTGGLEGLVSGHE